MTCAQSSCMPHATYREFVGGLLGIEGLFQLENACLLYGDGPVGVAGTTIDHALSSLPSCGQTFAIL